jgi:AcrR family transcriptional regulator
MENYVKLLFERSFKPPQQLANPSPYEHRGEPMTDADKREKIIAAAYEVLSKKGYDRASTKEIAAEAGVAQGLINYYFASKDQLFAEVFRRETERYCSAFDELLNSQGPPPELTTDSIAQMLELPKRRAIEEPEWSRLRYELFAIGLRSESARPVLKQMLQTQSEHFSHTIEKLTGFPPEQSRTLAALLHAMIEGLALQRLADPAFKYDEAYRMLAEMLGSHVKVMLDQREK